MEEVRGWRRSRVACVVCVACRGEEVAGHWAGARRTMAALQLLPHWQAANNWSFRRRRSRL